MKVRYGFVTNSSSSSFILSFHSKNRILEDLAKEHLSDKELSLLVNAVSCGTVMTRKQLQEYITQEVTEDIRYLRWAENQGVCPIIDWDAPIKGKWREERNRRVSALMGKIPARTHVVQIEAGINTLSGSILEDEILPNLSVTKITFNHH